MTVTDRLRAELGIIDLGNEDAFVRYIPVGKRAECIVLGDNNIQMANSIIYMIMNNYATTVDDVGVTFVT